MAEGAEGRFMKDIRIFDDQFRVTSFNDNGDRMRAVELSMGFGDKRYLMTVETYDIHAQRAVSSEEEEQPADSDPTYVISADEILPSDLLDIKQKSFEELKPFLVEQD